MRLLILNWRDWQHPWAGGAEVYLREVATRLVENGHEVTLYCQRGTNQADRDILDGVTVVRRRGRILHTALAPMWILRHQSEFDVVWEFTNKVPYGGPFLVQKPLIGAAMHVNGRTAPVELGMVGWLFLALEWLVYRAYGSTRFIAISESTREELESLGVNGSRIDVVHCGIADAYHQAPFGPRSPQPTIVCISRLKRYKRVDLLIRAMPYVRAQVPDARLVIVGTGDQEPHLKRLVDSLGLEKSVTFTGHVSEGMKRSVVDDAWVQVQPSMKEGWGLAVIEAAARGVPTVAFDVPGLRDAIVDGSTGLLVRSETAEALGEAVANLLTDHVKRNGMAAKGAARAGHLSWDAASRAVERIMTGVAARQPLTQPMAKGIA